MTKTISAGMQTHLDGGALTLAFAIKITRTDGEVFAYTSHDQDASISGTTYEAAPGFDVKSFSSVAGLAVGNNELTVLEGGDFDRLDVLAGRWDGAAYEIFQYNYKDLTHGTIPWSSGKLGNITPGFGFFTVELRDHRQKLQQDVGWIAQETCRNRFGDSRCGLDAAAYTASGSVAETISSRQFVTGFNSGTYANDWFGYGELTWTSGLNEGISVRVWAYADEVITLDTAMVFAIAENDTFTVVAGCRGRYFEDCRDKFDNLENNNSEGGGQKPILDAVVSPPTELPAGGGSGSEPPDDDDLPVPPPAPAPSPAPAPPPSAPSSRPFIVGLDYSQDYGAANVALHAKFDLSIRGFATGAAATHGTTWPNSVQATNSDHLTAQYVIINELADSLPTNADYYPLLQRANAQDAWAYNEPSGAKTQWTTEYNKYEINFSAAVPTLSGKTYARYKADDFDFALRLDNIPEATYVFIDNFRARPLVVADYNRDGVNESRDAGAAAWRVAYALYVAELKANRGGLKICANVNHDLSGSSFTNLVEQGFDEGCVGASYGTFAQRGISGVRTRMLALIDNSIDGVAILQSYGESTNYARARMAYAMAAMFDAGICLTDSTPNLHPFHIDEFYISTGSRVDAVPSAATEDGIWACEFENALFLCNPTNTSRSIDVTAIGAGLWKTFNAATYDNQQPSINNNTNQTTVTIGALDGRLLIKQ